MKVIFEGNNSVNVSNIQSVSVSTTTKRTRIEVKHKTGKQKVSYLAYPSVKHARRQLPEFAEEIAKELEFLSKTPDMPIDQVINLTPWAWGYLQVKLDANSDTSASGLALLCWDWPFGQNPSYTELEYRTGFKAAEIKTITSTDMYKKSIKHRMLESYDTPDEFKWWIRDYGRNMPRKFGKRMRLSEDAAAELIHSVAEQYSIDLGDLTRSWSLSKSERPPIGSGKNSVYLYYYQWDRDRAEAKGKNVWECKIGLAKGSLQKRLRDQATDTENFKLGIHIQTNNPVEIEGRIHHELKKRGQHIKRSLRTEWFRTSPSEVEEIYNFIGENSHESASSTLS